MACSVSAVADFLCLGGPGQATQAMALVLRRDAVLIPAVSAGPSYFDRALVRYRTKSCDCLDLGDHQSSQTVRRRYVEVETSMYYTAVVKRGAELCRRRLDMVSVAASNTERCPRHRGMAEEQRS